MKKLIALAVGVAFAAPALSQDKPAPPPAWHQGKPAAQAESKLAPLPGKMTETPASEIPLDKLKLPPGFKAEIWATGLPGGRAMARGDDGKKIYVGTRGIGRVYEVTDDGGKRTVRVVVDKLTQPAGVAYQQRLAVRVRDRQGAALRRHRRATRTAQPVDMTAAFNLPPEQHHNWKYVRLRPRRQALRAVRRAVQHLRAAEQGVRADPPLQRRRLGHGSDRARRAQHAGLRLASEDERDVVHRPRPRLDWATTGREDELNRMAKAGAELRLPVLPRQRDRRPGRQEGEAPARA